jgi:serine/threonine protein kinase
MNPQANNTKNEQSEPLQIDAVDSDGSTAKTSLVRPHIKQQTSHNATGCDAPTEVFETGQPTAMPAEGGRTSERLMPGAEHASYAAIPGAIVTPSGSGHRLPLPTTIGSYQVKGVLGRGGMGIVYLAYQSTLERFVALKMVLAGSHASELQLERFKAEARAVARLQHPNIVQVFEVGEQDGLPFFSLEYVEGQSLDRMLAGKPLPPPKAADLTGTICRAMQYAHDKGLLHRDLKPSNILMNHAGMPKVTDFGLAKQLTDDELDATRTGTIMGTPSYMSPEQAQGEVRSLGPATDQYSLGAMLYEFLTGRPPFIGSRTVDTLTQVVHKEPVPPCQLQPQIPIDLATICLTALHKDPRKRYPSCAAMADDLSRFLKGEPIVARPVSWIEKSWRWCRRNPWVAIPSCLAASLLVAVAFISSWSFLQISSQAAVIASERDEARSQRTVAERQSVLAQVAQKEAEFNAELAHRQKILAEEAQLTAEKHANTALQQTQLALENIQFIVTEIDDRLAQKPGMADLRIGLLQVLEKRWDELDLALAGGLEGQAIPTLMAVRSKIADAWVSLDRLLEADAQYTTLHQQAQGRVIIKNRSDAARFNLALLCTRWAQVRQRLKGDPSEAWKLLEQSKELLHDILDDPRPEPGSPAKFQIVDALQQTRMRMAAASLKSGNLHRAGEAYQDVEQLCQQILDEFEATAPWIEDLSEDRRRLILAYFTQSRDIAQTGQANLLCRVGRLEEALPLFDAVLTRRKQQVTQTPEDRAARDQLALQLRNYGQYMLRAGRFEEAVKLLGQAHDQAAKNYREDPSNANFKRSMGHSQYYWAVALDAVGQADQALALLERSRVLRQEMVDVSRDQANLVNLMLSEGRLGNVEETERLVTELSENTAVDPDLRIDIARALSQLLRSTQADSSSERWQKEAFSALQRALDEGLMDAYGITHEPDLLPLHHLPGWQELARQINLIGGKIPAP